jgi:hypothetical protein
MAFFIGDYSDNRAIGQFQVGCKGAYFEYRIGDGTAEGQGDWGITHGFIHEIPVCDGSVRFANVKKTVAHVCVDEDDEGNPIVEKWQIKHIWKK